MLAEGTRRFDLYDFFSVLIPGGAFVIGLLPFFPQQLPVFSTAAIVILIIAGFVFGRGIHALGLLIEQPFDDQPFIGIKGYGIQLSGVDVATNHREYFISELVSPMHIETELIDAFYTKATDYASIGSLPEKRSDLELDDHGACLETLYTVIRSYIHLDSRGRSRTFQAVLDFQRTTMMASVLLFLVYFPYGFLKLAGVVPTNAVDYNSYLSSLGIDGWVICLVAIIVLLSAYYTFERIRSNYRRYFIQYLMSDFINLQLNQQPGEADPSER